MSDILHNRRWYDNISDMTMALHVSRQLPEEVQMVIAKHLNEAIDDYRKLKRNDKNAISLGGQRVLGLFKASARQRWYDPQPQLHRAFTLMTTVPDMYLTEFAGRILKAGHYLDEQQHYGNFGDRVYMADTVESILQESTISIEESQGGIKLVANDAYTPVSPRHVLPVRPTHRPNHR